MPELDQFRQLLAIADSGTLSKAAEVVHLSQPALSRSIQKLEREWNVSLFDRKKNKLTLNPTGELAVQYARRILDDVARMTETVQAFDRSQRTIFIGSCAPAPILELMYHLSGRFADMSITSETAAPELLVPGLQQNHYQIIITAQPVQQPGIVCRRLCTEQLYLMLPAAHPLAAKKSGIYAKDLAGESMLLLREIGIWQHFVDTHMQQTEFIVQDQSNVFNALVRTSGLPAFATDLTMMRYKPAEGRVVIPFLDSDAIITFYCCAQEANRNYLPEL